MKKLPKVIIRKSRKPKVILPAPEKPRLDEGETPEKLTGQVQGKTASAAEERYINALEEHPGVDSVDFRYTIGAPRGLPGWKELDALVAARGMVYAFEVDSAFTHKEKARADVLHDAIVLKDLEKQGMNVYPKVFHIEGELDLVSAKSAKSYVRRFFG